MLPQALYEYYPSPWETSSGSWEIPKAGNQDDHHSFRYDLTIANQRVVSSNPSKWTNELNDYESLSRGLSKICCKHPSLTTKLLDQAEGCDAQQSVKSVKMMDWSDSRCVIGARVGQNRSTAVKSKAPINSERRLWRILTQLRRKPIREFGPISEADIFFPGRPPPKNLSSVCLSIVGNDFDSIRLKLFFCWIISIRLNKFIGLVIKKIGFAKFLTVGRLEDAKLSLTQMGWSTVESTRLIMKRSWVRISLFSIFTMLWPVKKQNPWQRCSSNIFW